MDSVKFPRRTTRQPDKVVKQVFIICVVVEGK